MDPFLAGLLGSVIGGLIVLFLTPIWSDLYPSVRDRAFRPSLRRLRRFLVDQRQRIGGAWAAYRRQPSTAVAFAAGPPTLPTTRRQPRRSKSRHNPNQLPLFPAE